MSLGTMYQYFSDKQALTYAVNEHYLNLWAAKFEVACPNSYGKPIGDMDEALVETYWQAKTEREAVARARYRSAVELDDKALVASVASRTETAMLDIFASAPDALDIELANRVLVTSISGSIRSVFEFSRAGFIDEKLRRQLVIMCRAYLAECMAAPACLQKV